MTGEPKWLEWAKRLQALAQSGLTFAKSPYDVERYEELRAIAAEMIAERGGADFERVLDLFSQPTGYATPKVDVRGVAFLDGQVLLVKEKADGLWTLPGGWADVGLSAARNVEKELLEESGFEARAVKLLAVYDKLMHEHPPEVHHSYKLFFRCELVGGAPRTTLETEGVAFFREDTLPPLSTPRVTERQLRRMFEHLRNPELPTDYD